ncbi:hypothetical protein CSPHI_10890 [Corynebacterium sphenisci DSM 44792]|uniref:Polysaccharide biosynthesis protein C-terminal domain-containing protein n=1 Tax=Corynebacterium sphenisci DSM 44792 TaxID=1437874 RepID=A0A1L7CZX5_9CORY|nr:hypothetical protein [Corynebacterium sphenisci]APT91408.1 hypothetical protein CSPHI_10890 [Corynebacterium sphenisci DSM 44792]
MLNLRSRIPAGGVRSVGTGLIAQTATFASMLIPMALGRLEQVGYIVVVSAIASIAARICGLAFPAIYPVLPEERTAAAIGATVRTAALAAGAGAAAGVVLLLRGSALGPMILWSTAMTVTMVCYEIVNGMFVRQSRYADYARVRLWYGLANLGSVCAISAFTDWTQALAATGVFAYAVGWLAGARVLRTRVLGAVTHSSTRETLGYMSRHRTAILAQTVDVFGSQLPALSVAAVGVTTGAGIAWSGLQRIAGGIVTTFLMLIAPGLDMRVAEAVRSGDRVRLRRQVNRSLGIALGLAALATAVTVPATILVLSLSRDFHVGAPLVAVLAVFCISIFTLAAIIKYLLMMGATRYVAIWSGLRALSAALILYLLGGDLMICVVAGHSLLFILLLIGFIQATLRRAGRTTPEGHPHA